MIELTGETQKKILATMQKKIDAQYSLDGEWTVKLLNSCAKVSAETTLQVLAEVQRLENQD